MGHSFRPIYKHLISKKSLLLEKFKKDCEEIWDNYYILESLDENNKKIELLVYSKNKNIILDIINSNNKDYYSFQLNILNNIGVNNCENFINWIDSFYDYKNNYYRFNLYDNNSKPFILYSITRNMTKVLKFSIPSCVVKNPIFYHFDKEKQNQPQASLALCTKNSAVISHINKAFII